MFFWVFLTAVGRRGNCFNCSRVRF